MKPNAMIVYRMAWAKCALMTVGGMLAAWTTAMDGVKWSELDGTEMTKIIFGCIGVGILVVVAFLDRTISKTEGEQEEIPGTPENLAANPPEK